MPEQRNESSAATGHVKTGEFEYRISIEIEAWCDSDEEAETVAARLADAADEQPTIGKFECWVGRNHAVAR